MLTLIAVQCFPCSELYFVRMDLASAFLTEGFLASGKMKNVRGRIFESPRSVFIRGGLRAFDAQLNPTFMVCCPHCKYSERL